MSGRRTRQTQPSPSSPAPDTGEQEEVGTDLSRVLSAVESHILVQFHFSEFSLQNIPPVARFRRMPFRREIYRGNYAIFDLSVNVRETGEKDW